MSAHQSSRGDTDLPTCAIAAASVAETITLTAARVTRGTLIALRSARWQGYAETNREPGPVFAHDLDFQVGSTPRL